MIRKISGTFGSLDGTGQERIGWLESITAADKAQSVPYVRMWEIRLSDGRPVHSDPNGEPARPLTMDTVAPPAFGSSVGDFRERPGVSLESITIKTVNPSGLILFRQLDISFTVHRPEVLETDPGQQGDSWSALITPGAIIAMEYGWSANSSQVRNPILNGEDAHGINGKRIIRFAVTNYRFVILPDRSIQFHITGYENGEYIMRHTYVVPGLRPMKDTHDDGRIQLADMEVFQRNYAKAAQRMQSDFKKALSARAIRWKDGWMVKMSDIFDIFFVQRAEEPIKQLGYKSVEFYMGYCNERVPRPKGRHYWSSDERYIGDFRVSLEDVNMHMAQLLANGTELTLYNFITPFLRMMQNPEVWEPDRDPDDPRTMPDVQMKVEATGDTVLIKVQDVKAELIRFTKKDKDSFLLWAKDNSVARNSVANRDEIRKRVVEKGIPYVEMVRGNSWIEDAQFDVVQDEMIQAILINRVYETSRTDVMTPRSDLIDRSADFRKVLYSSAISGQITTIGNHIMDTWALYWIDFGVYYWSGPFRVLEKQDVIDASGWRTTVRFISDGTDPLGTQGRMSLRRVMVEKSPSQKKEVARAIRKNKESKYLTGPTTGQAPWDYRNSIAEDTNVPVSLDDAMKPPPLPE